MFGLIKSVLATVFLFVFLFTTTLWVRSYWVTELYQHTTTTNENLAFAKSIFGVASGKGGVYLISGQTTWAESSQKKADVQNKMIQNGWARTNPQTPAYAGGYFKTDKHGSFWGFGFGSTNESNNVSTVASFSLIFPYWCPAAIFGMMAWTTINHCRVQLQRKRYVQSTEFADNDYLRHAAERSAA